MQKEGQELLQLLRGKHDAALAHVRGQHVERQLTNFIHAAWGREGRIVIQCHRKRVWSIAGNDDAMAYNINSTISMSMSISMSSTHLHVSLGAAAC